MEMFLIYVLIFKTFAASANQAETFKPFERLKDWFGNVSDLQFECPAPAKTNFRQNICQEILAVVSCDDIGARADYRFKVRQRTLTSLGEVSLTSCLNGYDSTK